MESETIAQAERSISTANIDIPMSFKSRVSVVQNLNDPEVLAKRIQQIERILNTQPVDLDALHTVSRLEGGFINNELRQRVWPKFLGVNRYLASDFRQYSMDKDSQVYKKIKCDIERSFWNFSHCREWDETRLEKKRALLSDIITATLTHNPDLQYYQGFHDVTSVFIEVFEGEEDLSFLLVEAVSKHFLRDYMGKDFANVTEALSLILQIVKKVDVKLYAFLTKSMTEPYFAVSWLITWFSHDLRDLQTVARVFDALITSHPMFCLYMCTALVLSCKEELFAMDCEMSKVHSYLVNVCENKKVSFDRIIMKADNLILALPPSRLKILAGLDMRNQIARKQVTIFLKPPCITRYCDTDAVLLEEFKKRKDAEVAARLREELQAHAEQTPNDRGHSLKWLSHTFLGGIYNFIQSDKSEATDK